MTIRLTRDAYIDGVHAPQYSQHDLTAPEEFYYVAIGAAEYTILPDQVRSAYPITTLLSGSMVVGQSAGPSGAEHLGWDDLRFPAQGINPAGAVAPPTVDNSVFPGTLLFASGATNLIAGLAQLPHAWKRGSGIRPHVHWAKSTSASGGVVWELAYAISAIGETMVAYTDWAAATSVVSDGNTAGKHALDAWDEIDLTGYKESTCLLWQVRRKHDAAGDDYGADARLFEVDFHYQVGKLGTGTEIPS